MRFWFGGRCDYPGRDSWPSDTRSCSRKHFFCKTCFVTSPFLRLTKKWYFSRPENPWGRVFAKSVQKAWGCLRIFMFLFKIRLVNSFRIEEFLVQITKNGKSAIKHHDFKTSRFYDSAALRFHDFTISRLRDFGLERFRGFAMSRFCDFTISRFYDLGFLQFSRFCDFTILRFQDLTILRFHDFAI